MKNFTNALNSFKHKNQYKNQLGDIDPTVAGIGIGDKIKIQILDSGK